MGRRGAMYRDNVFLGHSPSVTHVYKEIRVRIPVSKTDREFPTSFFAL